MATLCAATSSWVWATFMPEKEIDETEVMAVPVVAKGDAANVLTSSGFDKRRVQTKGFDLLDGGLGLSQIGHRPDPNPGAGALAGFEFLRQGGQARSL